MAGTITVDGASLTVEDVVRVAREGCRVELSKESTEKIERSRSVLESMAKEGRVIYGVTTGFGALSTTRITLDQAAKLQANLLRSHACAVGEALPTDIVRAILLLRLNTMAKGHSGVRLAVARLIQRFLNDRIHPVIPSKGSVGASGDLAPLSHMALTLIGEGTVEFQGEIRPSSEVLREIGVPSLSVTMKEGLALNNGTQLSSAMAALALHDAEQLLKTADIAAAESLEALRGLTEPFDPRIHKVRPFKGQMDAAENIRSMISQSKLVREKVIDAYEPVQDSYSIRCIPQIMGAPREAVAFVRKLIETEINSATDNPLVFPDGPDVLSGGNFHGQPVGLAMDLLSIALSIVGNVSERRVFRMLDASLSNGLPAFLVGSKESNGLNSGLMAAQYTAAALVSENKILSHPATVDSIPTSANMEDFVSMSATAGLKVRTILQNTQRILAIELICATQGLDFRDPTQCGRGTRIAYTTIRKKIPMITEDRAISGDIETVANMIADGTLLKAVESEIQPLR